MNIALILSGGVGSRLQSDIPKQYIKVKGRTIISYCLDTFSNHNMIEGIWIVCAKEWHDYIIADLDTNGIDTSKILGFSVPGTTRQLSILNGLLDISNYLHSSSNCSPEDKLLAVNSENDCVNNSIVIVHDAARPNVSDKLISSGIEIAQLHDGSMPVLPMKDTVYMSEDSQSVSSLLDRSKIFAGQAPEFFKLKKYLEANNNLLPDKILSINGSTEPAILAGLDIAMFPGDEKNIKITTKEDLDNFANQHK